jgi:3-deoxy-D-manno-octulosonate 8-phosphate phosphatase (KDO 8-P phosphatase)
MVNRRRAGAHPELLRRAARIRLVLTDVDGVLTDTGVYYSARGEAMKRFSMRDGMGVALLRKTGIETAFLTGERSRAVEHRARKLRLPWVFAGIADKAAHLRLILQQTKLCPDQLAYIGDDVNDLELLELLFEHGLTAAPADAVPRVARVVHRVCHAPGGHGAFREFADWILELRAQTTEGSDGT